MKRMRQTGFGTMEALLIVLVMVVLALAGYFVWQKNDNKSAEEKVSSQVKTDDSVTDFASCKAAPASRLLETAPEQCITKDGKKYTAPTATQSTEGADQNYLVIKEWGVKVTADNDYMYTVRDDNSMYLTSKALRSFSSDCDRDGNVGWLWRVKPGESIPFGTGVGTPDDSNAKKAGSYYYMFDGRGQSCAGAGNGQVTAADSEVVQKVGRDITVIESSFQAL